MIVPFEPCFTVSELGDSVIPKSPTGGGLTVTGTLILCVPLPPVPVITRVNGPVGVVDVVVTVNVEVTELSVGGVTEGKLKEQVALRGQLELSETAPLKLASEVTVIVEVPAVPCVMVNDDGFADSEKS